MDVSRGAQTRTVLQVQCYRKHLTLVRCTEKLCMRPLARQELDNTVILPSLDGDVDAEGKKWDGDETEPASLRRKS